MTVTVGNQPLSDVRVQSATSLTGTLPTGLCPGTYPARLTDPAGVEHAGGSLVVTGIQKITIGVEVPGPALTITGREQEVAVPLAALHLMDTTCGSGDHSLIVTVTAYVDGAQGRQPLTVGSVVLDAPGARHPAPTMLIPSGNRSTATVHLPGVGAPGMTTFMPTVTLVIPAKAIAGQYVISLEVTLA
jgi:hypothetical protein